MTRARRAAATAGAIAAALAFAGCSTGPLPWRELFDGQSLAGFAVTAFGGEGPVEVQDGALQLAAGSPLTGVHWQGEPPAGEYELEVTAARVQGSDFFCALTFPVGDDHLTLVLGGWGGSLCGLSNLDGLDAAHNETRTLRRFATGRDYTARVEVRNERVVVTLDGQPLCAVARAGRQFGLRPEVELSRPLGIASFATTAAVRALRWRALPAAQR